MTAAFLFAGGSVLATLVGGGLILHREWPEKSLWRFLAFGSGVLMGMTFLHLLPEAWKLSPRWSGGAVLASFVLFFAAEEFTVLHPCGELMGHCRMHSLGYGTLAALFLHSFADGLAMAFSFLSSEGLGFVVSSAILIHKFSDGVTLSSLFREAGYSRGRTALLNGLLSVATPLGLLAAWGAHPWVTPRVLAVLLGLAAGGFVYVSTADILPRIHRTRDALCWLFLLAGVAFSLALPHP